MDGLIINKLLFGCVFCEYFGGKNEIRVAKKKSLGQPGVPKNENAHDF
jgi:hypothetical protein